MKRMLSSFSSSAVNPGKCGLWQKYFVTACFCQIQVDALEDRGDLLTCVEKDQRKWWSLGVWIRMYLCAFPFYLYTVSFQLSYKYKQCWSATDLIPDIYLRQHQIFL